MKHKLIKTESYLLVVDDSEIKEGDYFLTKTNDILQVTKPEPSYDPLGKKIVAHLPLNGSPVLEGVDLLPELPNEAEELASEKALPHLRAVYVEGFEKCKEKYKYTEEDLKYALIIGTQYSEQDGLSILEKFEKYKSLLSKPKLPIAFKREMDIEKRVDEFGMRITEISLYVENNSSGKKVWVGKYIFNN